MLNKKINVLSLFDGYSSGQIALERAGIAVENYYASEIDEYAIAVTQDNYPETVQLGDVQEWREWDIDWSSVDLLIGGSPCQGFSSAGKGLNFEDPRSKLFFVYVDILNHIKTYNPNIKFFLENVRMKKEWLDTISKHLGVNPEMIDSNLVSAQNRKRYYWANWEITQPVDKNIFIVDILEKEPQEKDVRLTDGWIRWWNKNKTFQLKKGYSKIVNLSDDQKSITMTARQYASWNGNFIYQLPHGSNKGGSRGFKKSPSMTKSNWQYNNIIVTKDVIRKLSPTECERLQTVPDNYTKGVSNTQRYKMLGNGWTVDVIAHIFKGLK